jgi:CTP synthase (UTP-ammonia lyase)
VVEYVRNVLGFRDADHAESSPAAATLAVTQLSCAVGWGIEGRVLVLPGTRAAELYGRTGELTESYYCSYGVNPDFRPRLEAAGLHVTGTDPDGEPRIVELDANRHPFYVATLFIPQVRSTPEEPHPIVKGFAEAAAAHAARRAMENVVENGGVPTASTPLQPTPRGQGRAG